MTCSRRGLASRVLTPRHLRGGVCNYIESGCGVVRLLRSFRVSVRCSIHPSFEGRERHAQALPTLVEGLQSPHHIQRHALYASARHERLPSRDADPPIFLQSDGPCAQAEPCESRKTTLLSYGHAERPGPVISAGLTCICRWRWAVVWGMGPRPKLYDPAARLLRPNKK